MIKPEEPSRKSESWPKVNLSGSGPWLYAKEISASEQWGNNGRRLPQAKVPHLSELQRQLVLGGSGEGFQGGSLGRSRPVNALTATTSGLIALVRPELEEVQGRGGPGRRTQGPRQVRTVKTDCVAPPAGEPPAAFFHIHAPSRHCEPHYLYKKGKASWQTDGYSYQEQDLQLEQELPELQDWPGQSSGHKSSQGQGRK